MYIIGDLLVQEVKVRKSPAANVFADSDSSVVLRGYAQDDGWILRYWEEFEGRHGFGAWYPDSLGYWLPDSIWTEPWIGTHGMVGLPQNGCAWPSSSSPGGGFWYGNSCYVPQQIYQVFHGGGDTRRYIHVMFSGNNPGGGLFHWRNSGPKQWDHFVQNATLHIGNDTLYVRDGITAYQSRDNGFPLSDFCGYNEDKSVCWHDTGIVFGKDDILRIGISSKPVPPGPAGRMHGELRVWQDRTGSGSRAPGSVWLSWRIPSGKDQFGPRDDHALILAEQIKWEKRWGIHYEYRVLRDGGREWKTLLLDAIDLHEPEVIHGIPGSGWVYQRRKYLITGLDPMGEYSFCVRAANAVGPGKEICNTDVITPVSVESVELPATVNLAQNYPNPFNPSTTIEYELPSPEHVRLEVFDAQGHRVGLLMDGTRSAGRHSVRFDAGELASGLYLYRMQAGGKTYIRRMTLVR